MTIGDTAPTGPLNVATSLFSVVTAPGGVPPDQLPPVSHRPSPAPPVQVWLAARAAVGKTSGQASVNAARTDAFARRVLRGDEPTPTRSAYFMGYPPTDVPAEH